MRADTLVDSAQLRPGRHVWFARIPFAVTAIGGGAVLFWMKTHGVSQLVVTAVTCALILTYAILVSFIVVLRIREDQLGDNCYYLGFLFTLFSLAWALYEFNLSNDIKSVVANFSLALGSTIVGILLRVIINQARRDVLETERDARIELAQAVVRMRVEIDDAVLALSSFCRNVQQTASEQVGIVAETATKTLEQSATKVGHVTASALQQIDAAFNEFADHANELKDTSSSNIRALKALLKRIEKVEAPPDLVTKRLEPVVERVHQSLDRLGQILDANEKMISAALQRSSALDEDLKAAVSGLSMRAAGILAAASVANEAARSMEGVASLLSELARSVSDLITEQRRLLEQAHTRFLPGDLDMNEKSEMPSDPPSELSIKQQALAESSLIPDNELPIIGLGGQERQ